MTTKQNFPFNPEQHYALRIIDSGWVEKRALELAKVVGSEHPDTQAALEEAVEMLQERTANNLDDGKDTLLYLPGEDGDPFLVALPILRETRTVRRSPPDSKAHLPPHPKAEWSLTCRDQFEDVLFEGDFDVTPSSLDKNEAGDYLDPNVQLMWKGFNLYHEKMTSINNEAYKKRYDKTLGTFVVAKVAKPSGGALFVHSPYRHRLKADAMAEANRLGGIKGETFAIFRCLDVVIPPRKEGENNDVVYEAPQGESK